MKGTETSSAQPRLLLALSVLCIVSVAFAADYSQYPDWWFQREIIAIDPDVGGFAAPDDYVALTQGQLKNLATAAYDEFEEKLAGNDNDGAGTPIEVMVKGWFILGPDGEFQIVNGQRIPKTLGVDDFQVMNLGQLKNIARPFYDRLMEIGLGSIYPWPATGQADDFSVANLGQAKRMFQFAIGPLPPDPVTANYTLPSGPVHVQWTPVGNSNSYTLERRKIFGDGAAPANWAMIGSFSNSVSAFNDPSAIQWGVYGYRVYAKSGSFSSLPSLEARVLIRRGGTWDQDDDGVPDSEDDDIDGDGLSNDDELGLGLDPNNPDGDGDGIFDAADRYPDDERRSDDIPVKLYGAIDLNEYIDPIPNPPLTPDPSAALGAPGKTPEPNIIITDGNRVAWTHTSPSGASDPTGAAEMQCLILEAHQGAIVPSNPVRLWRQRPEPEDGHTVQYVDKWTLSPVGISVLDWGGSPSVAGNLTQIVYRQNPTTHAWESTSDYNTGTFHIDYDQITVTLADNNSWKSEYQQYSLGRKLFEIDKSSTTSTTGTPPDETTTTTYTQTPKIGDHIITSGDPIPFTWSGENNGEAPNISAFAISDGGHTVLRRITFDPTTFAETTKMFRCDPLGNAIELPPDEGVPFPDLAYAINDQEWIVGSLYRKVPDGSEPTGEREEGYEDPEDNFPDGTNPDGSERTRKGRGELGFVWDPVNGLQTFNDLLLPSKFENQLKNLIPFFISNPDPVDGIVTILLNAESWEDVEGGRAWVPRKFLFRWKAGIISEIESIEFSAASAVEAVKATPQGEIVGTIGTPDGVSPGIAIAPQFFPRKRERTRWGFDPSLRGDKRWEGPKIGWKEHIDLPAKETWTSVSLGGAFSSNDKLAIYFDSIEAAKQCYLHIPTTLEKYIGKSDPVLSQWTLIDLTGKLVAPPKEMNDMPELWVLPKGTTPDEKNVISRLKVMALPVRTIKVGIWRAAGLSGSVPKNETIIKTMKEIFKQACIDVELDKEGMLDAGDWDANGDNVFDDKGSDLVRFLNNDKMVAKINIAILPAVVDPTPFDQTTSYLGLTLSKNRAAIFVNSHYLPSQSINALPITCAHETAHILDISTRNIPASATDHGEEHDGTGNAVFDRGLYPDLMWTTDSDQLLLDDGRVATPGLYTNYENALEHGGRLWEAGLMRSSGGHKWLRHEDWWKANKAAENYE